MTGIRVCLLARRYTAGPKLEWPPDPVRLFYAAVAAWGEGGSDSDERTVLLWWEQLPPPIIVCSRPHDVLERESVGHFVPINDVAVVRNLHGLGPRISAADQRRIAATLDKDRVKAAKEFATLERKAVEDSAKAAQPRAGAVTDMGIMPESRPKQLRTFPTVRPNSPIIDYRWPDVDVPADLVAPMAALLSRIGRLGHPSTLVHCELNPWNGEDLTPPGTNQPGGGVAQSGCFPHIDGDLILRVQTPELLQELEMEYQIHQGRAPRSLPTAWAAYRWSEDRSDDPDPLIWERSDDVWLIMEVESVAGRDRWRQADAQAAVNVARTTEVTRALRGALLRHCSDPIPPLLSGHRGSRPNDEPHALFLVLPNAGSTHSDGSISAAAIAVPRSARPADVESIDEAVRDWFESGGELWFGSRSLRILPPRSDSARSEFDSRRYTTTRGYWARPSKIWTTVTPIALDRFPRALRGSGPLDFTAFDVEVAELVGRACTLRGLPAPHAVRAISGSPMVGIPSVGSGKSNRPAFSPFRTEGSGQVRFTTHVQVTFDMPVRGPLVLGSGRHFGYGLFLPSDRRRGER